MGSLKLSMLFLSLFLILTSCEEKEFFIVDKGQAKTRIVIPTEATDIEQKAAATLQDYIQQISGVKLRIVIDSKWERNTRVDRFFAKMKTKVANSPEKDIKELNLSYTNPNRFNQMKILPESAWEFDKWDKEDIIGFFVSVVGVIAVVGLLILIVSFGS